MSVYQRPADLAKAQQKRFDAMKLNQLSAHKELIDQGAADHMLYTGGGISKKALRQMGHPFARNGASQRGIVKNKDKFRTYGNRYTFLSTTKKGVVTDSKTQVSRGRIDPLPINRQSGKLRQSFFKTKQTGANHRVQMGFRVNHAKYVLSPTGTKKMIHRGFYSKSKATKNLQDYGIIARRHSARSQALLQSLRAKQRKP